MIVRIGCSGTDLSLSQAQQVAALLAPAATCEILAVGTGAESAERLAAAPEVLPATPGASTIETAAAHGALETALRESRIDVAVQRAVDLPLVLAPGLMLAAMPARSAAHERLLLRAAVHADGPPFLPLALGARLACRSARRRSLLATLRPDLELLQIKGQLPLRVVRLVEGRCDALLETAADLDALDLELTGLLAFDVAPDLMVPAPGQGALALVTRAADRRLAALLQQRVDDEATAGAVAAERELLRRAGLAGSASPGGAATAVGALVVPEAGGIGPVPPAGGAGHDPRDEAPAPTRAAPRAPGPGTWRAHLYLGSEAQGEGRPPRWAVGRGPTPRDAALQAWAASESGAATGSGPLGGLVVALVGATDGSSGLGERLDELGATVRREQVLAFRGVKAPGLPALLARLKAGDAVAVVSQEAAARLAGQRVPPGVVVAAVGPGTARALAAVGLRPDLVGKGGARALAAALIVREGGVVVLPGALEARPELADALRERGLAVERVVLYRTVASARAELVGDARAVVYMSPASVATSVAQGRESRRARVMRIGLGGATCDALQDEGLAQERPAEPGIEGVVALLWQLAHAPRDGRHA